VKGFITFIKSLTKLVTGTKKGPKFFGSATKKIDKKIKPKLSKASDSVKSALRDKSDASEKLAKKVLGRKKEDDSVLPPLGPDDQDRIYSSLISGPQASATESKLEKERLESSEMNIKADHKVSQAQIDSNEALSDQIAETSKAQVDAGEPDTSGNKNLMAKMVEGLTEGFVTIFATIPVAIGSLLVNYADVIKETFTEGWTGLKDWSAEMWNAAPQMFDEAVTTITDWLTINIPASLEWVYNSVVDNIKWLGESIWKVGDALGGAILSVNRFLSDSFVWLASTISNKVADSIDSLRTYLPEWMGGISESLYRKLVASRSRPSTPEFKYKSLSKAFSEIGDMPKHELKISDGNIVSDTMTNLTASGHIMESEGIASQGSLIHDISSISTIEPVKTPDPIDMSMLKGNSDEIIKKIDEIPKPTPSLNTHTHSKSLEVEVVVRESLFDKKYRSN